MSSTHVRLSSPLAKLQLPGLRPPSRAWLFSDLEDRPLFWNPLQLFCISPLLSLPRSNWGTKTTCTAEAYSGFRLCACARRPNLARTSHYGWTRPEGRGFSPAEIGAPTLYSSRAPRSLRLQTARGAGHGNNQEGFAAAGLKSTHALPRSRPPPIVSTHALRPFDSIGRHDSRHPNCPATIS
jgi:hypothetical protein